MAGRFPLLLDEHVPWPLAHALRECGWVVVRVVDLKSELGPGADDDQIFTYASQQGYVVLSSDERALWRPRLAARRELAALLERQRASGCRRRRPRTVPAARSWPRTGAPLQLPLSGDLPGGLRQELQLVARREATCGIARQGSNG